jgi:hypothetical protein
LALLRFLPSYQYLALCTDPCTVTLLDHAVRPPERVSSAPVTQVTWLPLAARSLGGRPLTSSVRHDLEDGGRYLVLVACFCAVVSYLVDVGAKAWTPITYRRVCPAMSDMSCCCGRRTACSGWENSVTGGWAGVSGVRIAKEGATGGYSLLF